MSGDIELEIKPSPLPLKYPLHLAAQSGQISDLVQLLPNISPFQQDLNHRTALHYASNYGSVIFYTFIASIDFKYYPFLFR